MSGQDNKKKTDKIPSTNNMNRLSNMNYGTKRLYGPMMLEYSVEFYSKIDVCSVIMAVLMNPEM